MNNGYRLESWILDNWSRMALPLAVVLLCSLPIFASGDNRSLILLYTLLPVYMIHQYEEHASGGFVEFFNSAIGGGQTVITKVSAFWVNILEVWLLFLASFYLAKYLTIGIAFIPIYLTIVNSFTHIVASIVLRRYNPGLYTGVVLFVPWGVFLLIYFNGISPNALLFNGLGLLVGIAGHVAIVAYALRQRSRSATLSQEME